MSDVNLDLFLDILKHLIRHPSVVGAEHSFFRVLQRELEELGVKVTWYEGLLVAQGTQPDQLMLSAHIDRHGLICTGPNEFQYAAFVAGNRSDLLGNSVSEQLIQKVAGRFQNTPVVAYEPWSGMYRGAGTISRAWVCEYRGNLIFDVDGMDHAVAGTPLAFRDRLDINGDSISAQLDNVFSAAALVYLFACGFQGSAFFTAQEEAGKSWRYLLEWFRRFGGRTNNLLVLDTSPYPDVESRDHQQVVLRNRDANSQFNTERTQQVAQHCERLGIRYSYKDQYIEQQNQQLLAAGQPAQSLGSTELGRISQASGGLVQGTTLQIPTTGYHTMEESAALSSVRAFLNLLGELGAV